MTGYTASPDFPTTTGAYSATDGAGTNDLAYITKLNASGTALLYSTYLAGSSNGAVGNAIAVDDAGNAYVTGQTYFTNFPTVNAYQSANGGSGNADAFVTKLNANGNALLYSTYLGGNAYENGLGIVTDKAGNAYVTGLANSSNFPTSTGAYSTTYAGGGYDGFITKLNTTASGAASLVYSTFLGGSNQDFCHAIAIDAAGNAYVTGQTYSSDFPLKGAIQTRQPGTENAFVTKLNSSGSALVYSTYLGGSNEDIGFGIAVDAAGEAYVAGLTTSNNFPLVHTLMGPLSNGNAQDAFVTKVSADGSQWLYSTELGGSGLDWGQAIAIDSAGAAYVTGYTASTDFPAITALQSTYGGGSADAFVAKIAAAPGGGIALAYSTLLGGSLADAGYGIAVDSQDNAYVTGSTSSTNFPTTNAPQPSAGGSGDAFIARIAPVPVATATVDDSVQGTGLSQFSYSGSGWVHCTAPPGGANCSSLYYDGTNSADNVTNDYATMQFSGVGIRYYATLDTNRGIVAVSVDGGPETTIDLYAATQQGNVLVYTSPPLGNGTHTLKIRVTGTKDGSSSNTYVAIDRVDVIAPTTQVAAIDSGGGAAGSFTADSYYTGGVTSATTNTIDTNNVTNPAPQAVYQSQRQGNFSYVVPNLVPGASYTVRLHFAEINFNATGQRVFNVSINGQQVLSDFDIYAAAGGPNAAIVEGFTTTADATGTITIQYVSVVNNAASSGIEIFANTAINSGGGIAAQFAPDGDYTSGNTFANNNAIDTSGTTNPAPQAVYQSERNGNFSYVVPDLVPGATYTIRLHFAEIYWNAAGQRIFNVSVNGTQILSNFDIYAAAGGQNKAIVEEVTAPADGNGQITIQYTSVVNLAKSSGIEVIGPLEADPPPNTVSRYMMTVDQTTLYNEGCSAGTAAKASPTSAGIPNSLIVLDFGQPDINSTGNISGTYLFNNTFASTTDISLAVKQFLNGFWNCTQTAQNNPFLVLAIGTNNVDGALPDTDAAWTAHGTAWGNMVNNIESYVVSQGYTSRESVSGADDIETGFGYQRFSRDWVNAYGATANNGYGYYDYGSADGCPPYGNCVADPRCNNNPPTGYCDWSQDAVWYMAWGATSAFALPEIYTPGTANTPYGTDATKWQNLSLYGYTAHGSRISFSGVMTQFADFTDKGGAAGGTNRPPAGYNQLYRSLSQDPRTAQTGLPRSLNPKPEYLTDITDKN